MSVRAFSKLSNGEDYISPNFKVKEFQCKDRTNTIYIDVDFVVNYLQKIRDHFSKPVTVVSAYRTADYNKRIGGTSNSYHLKGMAFDIAISGISPNQIAQYAETLGISGIIEYNNFTHIDSRPNKYWAYNDNGKITAKFTFA